MSAAPDTLNLSILAREYVKAGWALVPIPSGSKGPTAKGWNKLENCVTTPDDCRKIRANVGLAHAYSRTCVLDFDNIEKAREWLAARDVDFDSLWGDLSAVKISSGRPNRGKLLYKLPAGVAPLTTHQDHDGGIELRCASSTGSSLQDLLPPSIHPETGRPYTWEFDDVLGAHWSTPPELPSEVLALWQSLSDKLATARAESIWDGGEDELAARRLLKEFDPGMSYPEWFRVGAALHHEFKGDVLGLALWDEWSAESPKYPGWDVLEHKWGTITRQQGLLATLDGLRAEVRRRPMSPSEFDVLVDEPAPEDDGFEDLGPDPDADVAGRDLAPIKKKKGFAFYTIDEFMGRTPPSWIIKGLLPKAELGVIYGDSGAGKTFIALDQAMAIARGVDWRGRKTKQGAVAYIVAEGSGGFMDRVKAYCQQHQVDTASLPFYILPAAPDFMDSGKDSSAGVVALAREIKKLGPLAAIYVDTYARVMPGNENDAKDAGAVVTNCSHLSRTAQGAIVMLVHHSGKDSTRGARGSGVLRAAADVEFAVSKAAAQHTVTVTKMKDGEDGGKLHYKLAQITIGMDEDGEDRTSCVVEHIADGAPEPVQAKKRGEVQERILERLATYPDGVEKEVFLGDVKAHTPANPAGVEDKNWKMKITKPLGKMVEAGEVIEIQGVYKLPGQTCE